MASKLPPCQPARLPPRGSGRRRYSQRAVASREHRCAECRYGPYQHSQARTRTGPAQGSNLAGLFYAGLAVSLVCLPFPRVAASMHAGTVYLSQAPLGSSVATGTRTPRIRSAAVMRPNRGWDGAAVHNHDSASRPLSKMWQFESQLGIRTSRPVGSLVGSSVRAKNYQLFQRFCADTPSANFTVPEHQSCRDGEQQTHSWAVYHLKAPPRSWSASSTRRMSQQPSRARSWNTTCHPTSAAD
jgi:hypothetical protein